MVQQTKHTLHGVAGTIAETSIMILRLPVAIKGPSRSGRVAPLRDSRTILGVRGATGVTSREFWLRFRRFLRCDQVFLRRTRVD